MKYLSALLLLLVSIITLDAQSLPNPPLVLYYSNTGTIYPPDTVSGNNSTLVLPGSFTAQYNLQGGNVQANTVFQCGSASVPFADWTAAFGSSGNLCFGQNQVYGGNSGQTVTMPSTSPVGTRVIVKNNGTYSWTIASNTGSQIVLPGATTAVASTTIYPGQLLTFWNVNYNWCEESPPLTVQTGTLSSGSTTFTVPAGCHPWAQDTASSPSGPLSVTLSGTTATVHGTGGDTVTLFNAGSQ